MSCATVGAFGLAASGRWIVGSTLSEKGRINIGGGRTEGRRSLRVVRLDRQQRPAQGRFGPSTRRVWPHARRDGLREVLRRRCRNHVENWGCDIRVVVGIILAVFAVLIAAGRKTGIVHHGMHVDILLNSGWGLMLGLGLIELREFGTATMVR